MPSRFNIKMQRLILLALIPALSIITLATGVWLYRSLSHVIIEGFDRKLYALATTTASFIEGGDLVSVTEPYRVHGLAYDRDGEALYGVDTIRWSLVVIDREIGGATEIGPIGFDGITDLAFDHDARVLYGVSSTAEQLIRIDPDTGRGAAVMPVHASVQGLTWDGQRLLAAGSDLIAVYPDRQEVRILNALDVGDITGLTYHAGESVLYGVRGEEGILVTVDVPSGVVRAVGPLIPDGQAFGEVPYGEEAGELPAYGLAMNPGEPVLYAAADRLMHLDPETGAGALDLWLSRNYCNPSGEMFERFATPMRKILEDKDVTYLYTFMMGGRKDIVYIVDATPGEDWAPIGYEEDLPAQNLEGLVRAVEEGIPFISDVLFFELWGLLKVAAAPIYDAEGNIRALAGVDINIGLIRTKTRVALFQVLGFGALSLVLAGVVSLWVTRRLIRPINKLKYGALRIAAGQYQYPLEIKDPRELRDLSQALNGIGETLQRTVDDMAATSEQMEIGRRRTELAKTLPNLAPDVPQAGDPHIAVRWLGNRPHCADSSGCIAREGLVLHWVGHLENDALPAIKRRSDMSIALSARLRRAGDVPALMEELETLFEDQATAFILYDVSRGVLRVAARQPVTGCKLKADAPPERMSFPAGTMTVTLESGESLVALSSDPDGRWIDKLSEDRFPAEVLCHAGHVADRVENRVQSHTLSDLIARTGLLTVFTRSHTP